MTIDIRTFALAAIAGLAFGTVVAAQDEPDGLLNSLEVQQLVKRGEPEDHARLTGHFRTLADQYAREAQRHVAMSRSFAGNPNRSIGTGMSAHCKRLAELNTESAATMRELVGYHDKLATGAAATLPREAARFEGGAGAPKPSEKELNALAAKANTPAEHRDLEEYFVTLARKYTADAREHSTWAQVYRGTRIAQAAVHHDRLATVARDAAREANEAAARHKQLAALPR